MLRNYDDYVKFCEKNEMTPLSAKVFSTLSELINDTSNTDTKSQDDKQPKMRYDVSFESTVAVGEFCTHIRSGFSGNVISIMIDEFNDVWALVENIVSGSELPKSDWFRVELLQVKKV